MRDFYQFIIANIINDYNKIISKPRHIRRDQNYFEITKAVFKIVLEVNSLISSIISIISFIIDRQ